MKLGNSSLHSFVKPIIGRDPTSNIIGPSYSQSKIKIQKREQFGQYHICI